MKLTEIVSKFVESLKKKEIVLICGNLCSGKGHYCQTMLSEFERIGVSDVVRQISSAQTRSELSKTKRLDRSIALQILDIIDKKPKDAKIVIDGIRQKTILDTLQQHLGDQIKDIIWLDVPEQTLKQRFEKRSAGKDDMSFDKALQSDKELGIGDVESYIRKNHRVIPY